MQIRPEHLEQLELEVQHIFDSGANEIRVYEMIQAFIEKRGAALFIDSVVGSKDVQLMRDALLKSREDTARVREATAIEQTLEIYCDHNELPTVNEVLERIGRKH